MAVKVIFLDKDGTLIPDIPYNVDPARISLARGLFTETDLIGVEARLRELLGAYDIPLAGFYYCPHHVAGSLPDYAITCQCRKPEPGMILRAAREFDVDLSASWMIGDILNDIEAGRRAGVRTVLIDNGNETEWILTTMRQPHYRAGDLSQAAQMILDGGERGDPAMPGSERVANVGARGLDLQRMPKKEEVQ